MHPPPGGWDPPSSPPSRRVRTAPRRTSRREHPTPEGFGRPEAEAPRICRPRGPDHSTRGQSPTPLRKVAGRRRGAGRVPPPLPSPWRGGVAPPKLRSTVEHAACEPSSAHRQPESCWRRGRRSVLSTGPRRTPSRRDVPTGRRSVQPSASRTRRRIAVYPFSAGAKQLVAVPDAVPGRCGRGVPVGWPTFGPLDSTDPASPPPLGASVTGSMVLERPGQTPSAEPHRAGSIGPERLRRRPTRASHGLALDRAASSSRPGGRHRRSGPRQRSRWRLP